jgi:hypothetical protein
MADLRKLDQLNKRYWTRMRRLQRELERDPDNEVKVREYRLARALYIRTHSAIQDAGLGRPKEASPWCHCGNASGEMDFFADGEHPKIKCHHWRCRECKGVVQIG